MAEAPVFPARVRRRLTVAFVLVAGLAAAALAVGSYVLVRQAREQRFIQRSVQHAETHLELAALRSGDAADDVLAVYRRGAGFETMAVQGDSVRASVAELTLDSLPDSLRRPIPAGELAHATVKVEQTPYRVIAGRAPATDTTLYFFFSERDMRSFLEDLRNVLLGGWLVVTAIAAAVGNAIARRTLRPVRAASDAAHALAQGMLDTRLDAARVDEFGAWARDFNVMAAALEQKITELSDATERERRFTADVAHELRTPLASVVAAASLLEEDLETMRPDAMRPLELLIAELRRLRSLVDDLLELSRLDAGQEAVQEDDVAVDEVAASVVESYHWNGQVSLDVEPCEVRTDRRRVERVLVNLVANAVEHGHEPIVVRVRGDEAAASVEVRDAGPGIPAEDLHRIFDRFAKTDAARSSGGSGLGLAIARENAVLLGGALEAVPEDGGSVTFRLTLPIGRQAPAG